MDLELHQLHVLITGGSKGIGLACAKAFAAEGCSLHLASRDAGRLEAAKAEVLAALAAVLATVAWNMAEKGAFATLLRTSRGDALVLLTTFLLTIFRSLSEAIVVGFALGSVLFKDHYPDRDCVVVEKLKAAGAIILAKVNMSVRAMSRDGKTLEEGRLTKLLAFRGIERVPVEQAEAGDDRQVEAVRLLDGEFKGRIERRPIGLLQEIQDVGAVSARLDIVEDPDPLTLDRHTHLPLAWRVAPNLGWRR